MVSIRCCTGYEGEWEGFAHLLLIGHGGQVGRGGRPSRACHVGWRCLLVDIRQAGGAVVHGTFVVVPYGVCVGWK